MIPLSSRDSVTYTDSDGIVWKFKPKYGELETLIAEIIESQKDMSVIDQIKKADDIINEILLGWSGGPESMPDYPTDKMPASIFSQEEKSVLLWDYWYKANRLTAEEKKV
jgi:hypothetical protein